MSLSALILQHALMTFVLVMPLYKIFNQPQMSLHALVDILINLYLNLFVLLHLRSKKKKDLITNVILFKIHVLISLEKILSLYHVNVALLPKEILSVQKSTLRATPLSLQKFHRSYQTFTSAILLIDSTYMNACF